MTVLLLGLVTLLGSGWMMRRSAPSGRACLWVLAIGALTAGQACWQRDRLASYQVRLLGQRFQAGDGGLVAEVSGDRERADYYLPGAGNDPVAVLQRDSADGVVVRVPDPTTAAAVAVVTTPGRWRGGERVVLGSVSVEPGDRIRVGGEGGTEVFTFLRSKVSLLQKAGIGGTRDQLRLGKGGGEAVADGSNPMADEGDAGADGGDAVADASVPSVVVPYPEGTGVLGFLPRRPGIYQRTYPLAEMAAAGGFDGPSVARLRSFLYYDEGTARLVVLDDLVEVLSPDGVANAPVDAAAAWPGSGRTPRVTVAGLPYRDFPDPALAVGERYGARPLRSFGVRVDGEWVTVEARAEVHSIETAGLPRPVLAPSAAADGPRSDARLHAVRLAVGDAPEGPAGLTLSSPSDVFAAAGQAVLGLPEAPSAGWFELRSPSGQAHWETGRPFTLDDGEKGLLLRVDGLAASSSFLLLLVLLFLLAAAPFAFVETTGAVRGVALAALGIAALRVLLSLSAMARYPFVDEGHQIGLWLVPALPWFVCVLGRQRSAASARWTSRTNIATAVLGAALIFLAAALFPTSLAKTLVLTFAVACAAAFALLPIARTFPILKRGAARLRRLAKAFPARLRTAAANWPGFAAGLVILLGRFVLDVIGFREQIALLGTRIGLSVLYTPVALIAFALLVAAHHRRVAGARDGQAGGPKDGRTARVKDGVWSPTASRSLIDLCAFLGLAYMGTSILISDFGIAFTTLPGPLVVLALVGRRWARAKDRARPLDDGADVDDRTPNDFPASVEDREPYGMPASVEYGTPNDFPADVKKRTPYGIPAGVQHRESIDFPAGAADRKPSNTSASWWHSNGTDRRVALLAAAPLILFLTLQVAPGLLRPLLPDTEGPRSGLEEWSRNELLLLERGDPDALRLIGESRSEALAVMRETMRSYTRGNWWGQGFLEGRVSSQIRTTATREHVVTGLLASQWGAPGTLGLLALLAAVVRPLAPAVRRWSSRAQFVSATALLTFSTAGVYMVFANYGWALFTGKNVYLLGLDSLGDTLEALALLGLASAALALPSPAPEDSA